MAFTRDVAELVAEHADGALAISDEWARRKLGEVCAIQNGAPFKSAFFNTEGAGLPLLRIRDVVRGETETWYSGPYDDAFIVAPGDLVVGMDGDFNCEFWGGTPALLNQRVCRLTPGPEVDVRFLRHLLPAYLKVVNDATPSVTVKHLSSRTLAALPIPVPPLGDQQSAVAAIDTLLSRADVIEDALREAQDRVRSLRQAAIHRVLAGEIGSSSGSPSAAGGAP